jgi:DNA-binding NarL/FixJ family response regulator
VLISLRAFKGGHSVPIRILIADDDPAIRRLFRRLLEAQPNWQVCGEAVNGVDAVEQVKQMAPDLVILDLGMPLMNGIEAAREISQSNPALPLLLISVQEMSDQLVEAARNAGFKGAVTKSRGREVVSGVEAVLQNELFFRRDELR